MKKKYTMQIKTRLWRSVLLLLATLSFGWSLCACQSCGGQSAKIQATQSVTASTSLYDQLASTVGLPEMAGDAPQQLLSRESYVVSYNRTTKQPSWCMWLLTADHADGDEPRSNDFRPDEDVPEPRAELSDYRHSGWTRGHMCPAGDNKWDAQAQSQTYLLTNICPQDSKLNSGVWNQIESDCRQWAKKLGALYIVCGPLFYGDHHQTIGYNRIPVPEAFFKVVLYNGSQPWGAGFICTNDGDNTDPRVYITTIAQVEQATGMTFFPLLDADRASKVKQSVDRSGW